MGQQDFFSDSSRLFQMSAPIQLVSHVGKNGVLNLEVPAGFSNTDVLVTVQALESAAREPAAEGVDWKTFLAETYGACADLNLEEPEDLPPQQRAWP